MPVAEWKREVGIVQESTDSLCLPRAKGLLAAAYVACAASALVLNDMAANLVPLPITLSAMRCFATVCAALITRVLISSPAESMSARDVMQFASVPGLLACTALATNQLGIHAGGDARWLVGAAAPLGVVIVEWTLMGYVRPGVRASFAVAASALGGISCFAIQGDAFLLRSPMAPAWAAMAFGCTVGEHAWVKRVFEEVHSSLLTRVLIANVLAGLVFALAIAVGDEYALAPPPTCLVALLAQADKQSFFVLTSLLPSKTCLAPCRASLRRAALQKRLPLALSLHEKTVISSSCLCAVLFSLSSFKLRDTVSAAAFSVLTATSVFCAALASKALMQMPLAAATMQPLALLGLSALLTLSFVPPPKQTARAVDPNAEVDRAVEEAERMIAEADKLVEASKAATAINGK